jgi:hypothetical protein
MISFSDKFVVRHRLVNESSLLETTKVVDVQYRGPFVEPTSDIALAHERVAGKAATRLRVPPSIKVHHDYAL